MTRITKTPEREVSLDIGEYVVIETEDTVPHGIYRPLTRFVRITREELAAIVKAVDSSRGA